MFGVTGEQHTRSPARKGVPTAQAPLMTAKSSIDCLLLSDVQLSPFGTYAATVRVEPCVREGRCAPRHCHATRNGSQLAAPAVLRLCSSPVTVFSRRTLTSAGPRSPAPLSSLWLTNTRTRHSVKLTDGPHHVSPLAHIPSARVSFRMQGLTSSSLQTMPRWSPDGKVLVRPEPFPRSPRAGPDSGRIGKRR